MQLTGYDYSWNFQAGVANQYLLGAGLQPSAFGVFLVGSLAAFDPRRPWPAVAAATIACVAHFTYLLPTGLLFVGYLAATGKVKGPTVRLALLMAGCLLPIVAFNAVRFRPTDAATFAEAQRLLVEVRIPHHCRVEKWLDPIAGLQLAWVAAGIFLIRRTPLGRVLAVSAGAAIILSLVAVATGYHLLLLLFPWRVSAVLVPVATAIIATRLAAWVEASLVPRRVVWAAAGTVVVAAVAAGVAFPFLRIGYATNDAVEGPLLAHVREAKRPGDVYLIPTRIPDLAGGKRGSASTTFTPPPRPVPGR